MAFWPIIQILIGVLLMVVSFAMMPQPKKQKPQPSSDLDDPTAEAGRPVPVVFGSVEVKGANIIWFGDKGKVDYEVNA